MEDGAQPRPRRRRVQSPSPAPNRRRRVQSPSPAPNRRQYRRSSTSDSICYDSFNIANYHGLRDVTIPFGPGPTIAIVDRADVPRIERIIVNAMQGIVAKSEDFRPEPEPRPSATLNFTKIHNGSERREYHQSLCCTSLRNRQLRVELTDNDGKTSRIAKEDIKKIIGKLWRSYIFLDANSNPIGGGEFYKLIVECLFLPNDLPMSIASLQTQRNLHLTEQRRLKETVTRAVAQYGGDLHANLRRFWWLRALVCRRDTNKNEASRRSVIQKKENYAASLRVSVAPVANNPNGGAGTTHEGPETQDHQAALEQVRDNLHQIQLRLWDLFQQFYSLQDEEAMQANYDNVDHQRGVVAEELTTLFNQLRGFFDDPLQEIERLLQANGGEISNALLQFFARLDATELADLRATFVERAREKDRLDHIAELLGQIDQLRRDISDTQNRESGLLARQMELEAARHQANQAQRRAPAVQDLRLRPQFWQNMIKVCETELWDLDDVKERLAASYDGYWECRDLVSGIDDNRDENLSEDELEAQIRNVKEWLESNQPQEGWLQSLLRDVEELLSAMQESRLYRAAILRENNAYHERRDRAIYQLWTKVGEISTMFGFNDARLEVDHDDRTFSINPGHFAEGTGAEQLWDGISWLAFVIGFMSIQPASQAPMAFFPSVSDLNLDSATLAYCLHELGLAHRQSTRQSLLIVYEPIPDDAITQHDLRRRA